MTRRPASILLALCFSVHTPARALASAPAPANVEARAELLFGEEKYLEAAQVWTNALNTVPESPERRGDRNSWAIGAVNAYKSAFEKFHTQCSVIGDGIDLADRYLAGLVTEYGNQATRDDDYTGMSLLRAELDALRAKHGCPGSPNQAASPPAPTGASSTPSPGRSDASTATDDAPARRTTPGLAIGTGVSASLMVGMGIASLATYLQIRRPGGGAYEDIYDAAVAAMIKHDKTTDLCVEGRGLDPVTEPCGRWATKKQVFIATTVLTGVFAVTTAVLTGLLIKKRRQAGRATALLRHHQVQLGAAPQRGGASFAAGFRF